SRVRKPRREERATGLPGHGLAQQLGRLLRTSRFSADTPYRGAVTPRGGGSIAAATRVRRTGATMPRMTTLLVAAGGLAGVMARYGLGVWIQSIWTVVAINIAGSLVLGFLVSGGAALSEDLRTALGVGVLGGFTTFSTLTVQTVLEA